MKIADRWEVNDKDIYTVVTQSGEYVGRLKFNENVKVVTITNPLLVMMHPDGSQQYVPTVSMTGENEPKEVTFNATYVITIVPTHESYAREYVKAQSGIVLPNGSV